ncbi:TIGR03086 family metal-binding protein [Rhodococcus sp. X156]|uniref:TIGR03086 family metal-binding protein n=1 Tax=Rhodococcus sp. X156 TaxID=2499145 RepID=UPI000FDA99B1|nr:TIGR03086 family metal-binding protein [Rhodococcus sp. X156]
MTSSTQHTTALLDTVLDDLGTVVATIGPGQLHNPTPCTEMDVAQLRQHVLAWLSNFADGFAHPDNRAQAAPADPGASVDHVTAVRAASDQLVASLQAGAAEQPLYLGDDAMPGEMALGMILWEYLVHGWDLARATGQPWAPPEAAAAQIVAFAPSMLSPDYQGEGKMFADPVPVPPSAPAMDQLLGLSGRDPRWSPA